MNLKALIVSLRYIFTFRPPELRRLDCINLVIDGKLLLFIAWDAKKMSYLKILQIKQQFYKLQSAQLLKLPDNIDQLQIIAGNLWKKKIVQIELIKIRLDDQTRKSLIDDINRLDKLITNKGLQAVFIDQKKSGLAIGEEMPGVKLKAEPLKSLICFNKRIDLNSPLFEYKPQNPPI